MVSVSGIVKKNIVVLFGDKVDELIVDYVKSADEFYAALQKAMHLIRLEVIAQGNKFAGSFDI